MGNKYAFIVVSLYGKNFRAAGSDVWSMFHSRGWTAIINDDLIETVLYVACLGIAALTSLVGGGVAYAQAGGDLESVYTPVLISVFFESNVDERTVSEKFEAKLLF